MSCYDLSIFVYFSFICESLSVISSPLTWLRCDFYFSWYFPCVDGRCVARVRDGLILGGWFISGGNQLATQLRIGTIRCDSCGRIRFDILGTIRKAKDTFTMGGSICCT